MGRNLLSNDLTAENIADAKLRRGVDPVDTLRRIAREWLANRTKCRCGSNEACWICEIDYLLEEAFEPREL